MEKSDFITKLYLDPIENVNLNKKTNKRYRLKEQSKEDSEVMHSLPNLQSSGSLMGSVIMQNWNTKSSIPHDIGGCLNFPIIIDRSKFKKLDSILCLPDTKKKLDFSKTKIRENGERLIQSTAASERVLSTFPNSRYQTEVTEEQKNQLALPDGIEDKTALVCVTEQKPIASTSKKETDKKDIINFSNFNRHLYLRDNDFLYAKRVGGPLEFSLCTYQDIKAQPKRLKPVLTTRRSAQLQKSQTMISGNSKKKNVEYITISKNTVLHYQNGVPSVYSIQEWIENYEVYQRLMNLSLFKNFKTAKLFDLWRRFFKKTKRAYYTEKLKKKFHLIDGHLRNGIFGIRKILKQMEYTNIFEMEYTGALLLNKFTELHKEKLKDIDQKIENYRTRVKNELVTACNKSYLAYKSLKKITLDDNVSTGGNQGEAAKEKKEGANIQNFLKDAIPYAQDATRKTHYKKLLRYIRVVDYLFNEAKYKAISFSLDKLDNKFKRLYQCYVNKWVDPPMIITMILCMKGQIYYNPSIELMREFIFDNFIQEKLYTVIYKKSFIDPQEFPNYMSVFEEVFESSVDQNANLNSRIMESEEIITIFNSIKNSFELCKKSLIDYSTALQPVLRNYNEYNSINFKELEKSATPDQLKELLDKFLKEAVVIRALKNIVNVGIFEFHLDYLIDMVTDAPKLWLQKIRTVIPNVFVAKLSYSIQKLGNYMRNLSINPVDVESFIKLKKAVEECLKDRKQTEQESNEILDLSTIVSNDKEIKLQEYDSKLIIELKDLSVKYERKLDAMSYFIDNNIQKFRLDLKTDIQKFDNEIKSMISELNNDTLNKYAEDTFAAIDLLEENSIKISKALHMKDKYKELENDLEIDESLRSNFENLSNLEYDYNLKVEMWNSVKEFQDIARHWNDEQLMAVKIDEMQANITKWNELCQKGLVDLDFPNVPTELLKRVKVYEQLVPILTAIQNPNILNEPNLLNGLLDILRIDNKLEDPMYTVQRLLDLPGLFDKSDEIIELNTRANEERKLKDMIKNISEGFYTRKLPIKMNYNKKEFDKEFEFTEENIETINRMYLNRYCQCVFKQLQKTEYDLGRYYNFLRVYASYQEYIFKSEGIMENGEFSKEMPAEYKKLLSENLKKNLYKHLKDYPIVNRFLDNAYEKVVNIINNIITNFEQNYKAITTYLDKKRKEFPKYFLLSDSELANLHIDKDSVEIKTTLLLKLFPWIKTINIGSDIDEFLTMTTKDGENISLKFTKSSRSMKDVIDVIETGLFRKLKEMFKKFKKEYEDSVKARSTNRPKNVLQATLDNKDNLVQGIFNCMYFFMIDSIERALAIEDQAFDKLFDLYHEVKDDRLEGYISKLKAQDTPMLMRRILVNLISLENYCKGIIENLIREDVTTITDYNYMKIIQTKLENDTYVIHMLTFTLEYGFEYVGIENNFVMIPESDKLYLSFANCINVRKPFLLYGVSDSGKKEIIRTFANLCGKRINYISGSNDYSDISFNKTLLGNLKNGAWICIDRTEAISKECFDVLCNRIMEVYRIIRENHEDEEFIDNGDKYQINLKQTNIFMMRNISSLVHFTFDPSTLPPMAKNYFRHIAFPVIEYKHYLTLSLMNLGIDDAERYSRKIMYVINYTSKRIEGTRKKNLAFRFVYSIIIALIKKTGEFTHENQNEIIRCAVMKAFWPIATTEEINELNRLLNVVFNMKDYVPSEENEYNDENVNAMVSSELAMFKFNSTQFEQKAKHLIYAMNNYDSFVLVGPPLSGKSQILLMISEIMKNLNKQNKEKYAKMMMVKMYPKSKNPSTFFSENKIECAYQYNNNFFQNVFSLFNSENKEILEKLNANYAKMMKLSDTNEIKTLKTLDKDAKIEKSKNDLKEDEEEEENVEVHKHISEENDENILKSIVFDGQIDSSWIEYLNNIYHEDNMIDHPSGDRTILNHSWKIFYETLNVRHATPSFLTRQFILGFDYTSFNHENILYSWIETNPKITANNELKNYIRGLFENFFPKIYDFILNNKYKNLNFSENYSMKVLISIFDSVFPLFNFEDKKIGRKNFNVIPKIELIKKSTLSIFIFSCAWTMMFLSNYVIKTKIEKLVSDIFKADDLKGPIFEYYIDESTNDFEQWSNLLTDERFAMKAKITKDEIFYYDKIFVNTIETIPYSWLCEKFIDNNIPIFYNGKENSGKSFLMSSLLERLFEDDMKIKKIKYLASHKTKSDNIEKYLMKNLDVLKRDIYGDKYGKKVVLCIDDLNLNIHRDENDVSQVIEYIRSLIAQKCVYDTKTNSFNYIDKFNIISVGNISSYPIDDHISRFMSRFVMVTQVLSEDAFLSVFKPTLELHLRNFIPNTSSITATQYIQASLKLNALLNKEINNDPHRLHLNFNIRDVMRVIQSFHMFKYQGGSDYPEYLKKLFFYESARVYEDRFASRKSETVFREKICEAYSSVFKQDKVTPEDIFATWDSNEHYMFARNFVKTTTEENNEKIEHIFYANKIEFIEFIKSKIERFYTEFKIRGKSMIKVSPYTIEIIIKMLRIMENEKANMIIVGNSNSGKNTLLHLSAFISGYTVIDIDPLYASKTQESFVSDVIKKVLVSATYKNKKTILFGGSWLSRNDHLLEVIEKLLDTKEILNNFKFIDETEYGKISVDDVVYRLEHNISVVLDVVPKSESYRKVYIEYPFIAKSSSCIYIHLMKENDLKSYLSTNIEPLTEISIEKTKLVNAFYNIYTFAKELYEDSSQKIKAKLDINQKHFCFSCEFFSQKYNDYKNILQANQKKYQDAIAMIGKSEALIEATTKDIEGILPSKTEAEKTIEDKKNEISKKVLERSNWKAKKMEEEKPIMSLEKDKNEKLEQFDNIITPFKDALQKALNVVNRISSGDITEIKNTWDGLAFGKFILSKIFECIGEANSDWDNVKRSIDIKIIKAFANISALKLPENLISITKEITSNSEFSSGDKYQKPFKTCGVLCDYFLACKNYFDQMDEQKPLLDEIENIKEKIKAHNDTIKQYNKNITNIEKESSDLEKSITDIEKKKQNIISLLDKKAAIKKTFEEFIAVSKEKNAIWEAKKQKIDSILSNYDFYLMLFSTFISYAAPLSKSHRNKLKMYIYSLGEELGITVSEITISEIAMLLLDAIGKDNEFLLSLSPFNEFYKENFVIMYMRSEKIPFIIDNNRLGKSIISTFVEFKNQKGIMITTWYKGNNSELFDKVESAMKNGSILFIDQCDDEVIDLLRNVINDVNIGMDMKKRIYQINGKTVEKNEKFRLFLMKSKINIEINSKINEETLVVNFNATSDIINKNIFNALCTEQMPKVFNTYSKSKNDIAKDNFRLLEIENKIHNYINQFDLSGNLDKIEKNENLLERYKIEIQSHSQLITSIESSTQKLSLLSADLQRFNLISTDATKIYKWYAKFFFYDNLYMIPIEIFANQIKNFYKEHYGLYKDKLLELKRSKKSKIKDEEENEDNNEDNNEGNDEEVVAPKNTDVLVPTYEKDSLFDLIMAIYNKNINVYVPELRNAMLLINVFFYLKEKDEIPSNYKSLILLVKSVYFDGNIDTENYNEKSPFNQINSEQWNSLKMINDNGSYVFSIVIDHMENHIIEWDEYLNEENKETNYIAKNFELFTEELESTLNVFLKFLFFSILRPQNGKLLLDTILSSSVKQEVAQCVPFVQEFDEDITVCRRPILIVNNNECNLDKEIKDYYMPRMKIKDNNTNKAQANANNANTENNANQKNDANANMGSSEILYKEIIPSKIELTLNEQEIIHTAMKNGGVIVVRKCNIIRDTLMKICDEIADPNTILNSSFKLILLVERNEMISSYLYNCRIFNRSDEPSVDMKDYIIDIVRNIPEEIFNKFMNRKTNTANNISLYMKKAFFYTILTHCVLVRLNTLPTSITKIPLAYRKKDLICALTFIDSFITALPEDRVVLFSNTDNDIGFTYSSLVTIMIDAFVNTKMVYADDIVRLNKIIGKIFEDEATMLNEKYLFNYNEFIIDNDINKEVITHQDVIDKLSSISSEKYYSLIYSLSPMVSHNEIRNSLFSFYDIIYTSLNGKPQLKSQSLKYNTPLLSQILNHIKLGLPDTLNASEGYALLFKVNKLNDFINPFDTCLLAEMDSYNNYIAMIQNDITSLSFALNREMEIVKDYADILDALSTSKLPAKWALSKNDIGMKVDKWLNMIKERFSIFNTWINEGGLKCYDFNVLINKNLFIGILPQYFIRKFNDDKISPEKVKIKYEFTEYYDEKELTDEVVEKINKRNEHKGYSKEYLFIKGLVMKNAIFQKDKIVIREFETYKETIEECKCPIAIASFIIDDEEEAEEENEKIKALNEEEEEEEDEEDEEEDKKEEPKPEEEKKEEPDKPKQEEEKKEEEEEEEENIINVPFVDREYANMNKYTMKQPYGIFDIKIPKDAKEDLYTSRNIKITLEN